MYIRDDIKVFINNNSKDIVPDYIHGCYQKCYKSIPKIFYVLNDHNF